jgi:hypothetical protein
VIALAPIQMKIVAQLLRSHASMTRWNTPSSSALNPPPTSALCQKLRRFSAAVATSREGHRSPRSGLGRERSVDAITALPSRAECG